MNTKSIEKNFLLCAALSGALFLWSCGGSGGGGSSGSSTPTGTVNVQLTDSPACGFNSVNITVDHVEISADGNSWTTIPVDSAVGRIDLLSLTNGVLVTLGQTPLPAGTYQQVRLVLKENGSAAPWANSVVITGATSETALKTPSAQQSGYKIIGPFTVQEGKLTDLVLDFDACKSVVVAGKSGQYLLKPVVTAIAKDASGSISGTTVANSQVLAEQQSTSGPVVVKGTVADSTGAFTLAFMESGSNVDVVVVPPPTAMRATAIVQNVPVATGAATSIGNINPATSTINTVSGTVTEKSTGSAIAANLVAEQTITGTNRTYVVTSTVTDTGPYSIPLAASGPWVGTFGSLPILLIQDIAVADVGVYSITATDALGYSSTQQTNVSTGPASVNFNLGP
ncbi:DUF4382 domain-containing protein [Propionivibrio limicola]|uniref:DUF4382 domain-containing protein n=1 Tax=Propionivibrio limicola TaxID=167645 RepID=UPI001290AB32|nr:DUF4382 domain-containing protein [Propionivibrio limicola]